MRQRVPQRLVPAPRRGRRTEQPPTENRQHPDRPTHQTPQPIHRTATHRKASPGWGKGRGSGRCYFLAWEHMPAHLEAGLTVPAPHQMLCPESPAQQEGLEEWREKAPERRKDCWRQGSPPVSGTSRRVRTLQGVVWGAPPGQGWGQPRCSHWALRPVQGGRPIPFHPGPPPPPLPVLRLPQPDTRHRRPGQQGTPVLLRPKTGSEERQWPGFLPTPTPASSRAHSERHPAQGGRPLAPAQPEGPSAPAGPLGLPQTGRRFENEDQWLMRSLSPETPLTADWPAAHTPPGPRPLLLPVLPSPLLSPQDEPQA